MKKEIVYAIIEKYYHNKKKELINRVNRRVGSRELAEDIVQEAFARALKYYDGFNPDIHEFGAWFSGILDNTTKSLVGAERSRGISVDIEVEEYAGISSDPYLVALLNEIKVMINEEADNKKYILYLYFIQQYKPSDIVKLVPESYDVIKHLIQWFKIEVRHKYGEDLHC